MAALLSPAAQHVSALEDGGTLAACGLSGFGKTTIVQRGLAGSPRLVVFDPYSSLDRRRAAAGQARRRTWQGDAWTYEELVEARCAPLRASRCRVVLDPHTLDEAELGRRVSRALDWCWAAGDVDVVLEEGGLYSRLAVPLINRLSTGGGHAGIRLILIAQGWGRICKDARRNVTRALLFAQEDEGDLALLAPKIGRVVAASLATFKKGNPPVLWKQGDRKEETS